MANSIRSSLQAYFIFSVRERRAILLLLLIFTGFIFLPEVFPSFIRPLQKPILDSVLIRESSALNDVPEKQEKKYLYSYHVHPRQYPSIPTTFPLFEFDPNTAEEDVWRKLGVRQDVVQRIIKYRQKGGRFRKATDLRKIYGFSPESCERLLPYVRISSSGSFQDTKTSTPNQNQSGPSKPLSIDINTADESAWKQLPGIGPGYARRILNFREKLGGFYSAEQIAETYGLPDSVYKLIKHQIGLEAAPYRFIELNDATYEVLTAHPYIDYRMAKLLIAYRREHGPYKTKEEILKIATMDTLKYRRLAPYLKIK